MQRENVSFSTEDHELLEEIYEEFREKKSLMILLQQIQTRYGYVPSFSIKFLADRMGVSESHIYGVITFYAQFRTKPVGKNIIKVCQGTACHVGGAKILAETLVNYLGLNEIKDTTDDGVFTLQNVACLGCCALAPAIMINNKVYGKLDVNKVREIIEKYRDLAKENK